MDKQKRKLILIGWDGADWNLINPLMDAGLMPNLEKLVNNGVIGNLATLEPSFSPMLWTSIATGKRPDKHGVLGFSEPMPDHSGVRPVSGTSRKVKAVWNILQQKGYKVHNVGWWPSHPAEPINGVSISNLFQQAHVSPESWRSPKASVHPERLTGLFEELRVHPAELTEAHILPFVPKANEIKNEKDRRLYSVAKILAENATLHSCATWILENLEWDFLGLYLDGIDHFSHGFMKYHPPKMNAITQEDYDIYNEVINSAYRFHDMMLGRIMELAGDDATYMLVSDHGFHSDHLRTIRFPKEPAGPAYHHRDLGVVCVSGNDIKKDERIYGASLLNITPTILQLFDLPTAQDMDGAVLIDAFEKTPKVNTIPSWEEIDGESGMYDFDLEQDPYEDKNAISQLVDLGYIEDPGQDARKSVDKTLDELDYNLARVYLGSNRSQMALPILERLHEKHPEEGRFLFRLITCYKEIDNINKCEELHAEFKIALKDRLIPIKEYEEKRVLLNDLTIKDEKKSDETLKKQKEELEDLVSKHEVAVVDSVVLQLVEANILLSQNKGKQAIEIFKSVENKIPKQVNLLLPTANAFLKLNELHEAEKLFNDILEIDSENPYAFKGLSQISFKEKDYMQCIEMALSSVGLLYHQPFTHFLLGKALIKIEQFEDAANALEVSLHMLPGLGKARNELIRVYNEDLNLPEKANSHKDFFLNKDKKDEELIVDNNSELFVNEESRFFNFDIEKSIVIVSGLPRSGTSMMMQILEAGGVEVFTDKVRKADNSNTKGYYEHESVKRLSTYKKWLNNVKGKAVKVVSHQLSNLPDSINYKIIFMQRDMSEIIDSQHKMLSEIGKTKKENYHLGIEASFKKNLKKVNKWMKNHHNIEVLFINYADVVNNPKQELPKIIDFLGKSMDVDCMTKVVRKDMYRTINP